MWWEVCGSKVCDGEVCGGEVCVVCVVCVCVCVCVCDVCECVCVCVCVMYVGGWVYMAYAPLLLVSISLNSLFSHLK